MPKCIEPVSFQIHQVSRSPIQYSALFCRKEEFSCFNMRRSSSSSKVARSPPSSRHLFRASTKFNCSSLLTNRQPFFKDRTVLFWHNSLSTITTCVLLHHQCIYLFSSLAPPMQIIKVAVINFEYLEIEEKGTYSL